MDGGAPVWNTPAVDPELGLIYFATGNPGPDYNGSIRARRQLVLVVRSSPSTRRPANTAGTSKQVHHDIWDYDAAAPVDAVRHRIERRARARASRKPSKTGWVYILDRTNGTPLVGIDERPVPQEPRQGTAATQPYPRGDAFVPQQIDIAPEGTTLVNERQDLHAVLDDAGAHEARPAGRRELAAELVRSRERLLVCLRLRPHLVVSRARGHGRAAGRRRRLHRGRHRRLPHDVARRVRGRRRAHQQARLAAALAGPVLQRLARDGRRARVRRAQRRPAHGARLRDRHEALGVSNGRGHELAGDVVRVERQAVRRRVFRRQHVRAARRAATAYGYSAWTARSSPCRPRAR